MAPIQSRSESGQALVLLVLAMVGMLGFAAIAIDGGQIYLEQRRAQAAADNAVLAAAFSRMQGVGDTNTLRTVALVNAGNNGFDNDGTQNFVEFHRPPRSGPYAGNSDYMEVVITSTLQTAFAHFVYGGPAQVTVHAIARGIPQGTPLANYAIITLEDCTQTGRENLESTGGGNSGGILTYNGGMWMNTTETSSSNACGLSPGSSAGNWGIRAEDPWPITSVGSYDYVGSKNADKITPLPIETGGNGGVPLPDPLASVPAPVCTGNGSGNGSAGNPYQPGNYNGSGQPSLGGGKLSPGIYCINGGVHLSGNNSLTGDGVVLVQNSGTMLFTGNAELRITAPTSDNCTGTSGDPTASCTYIGLAFWGARNNCGQVLEARGNGYHHIRGTVYGPCGAFMARGGGSDPEEASVWGQVIVGRVGGNGNGSFRVYYDQEVSFQFPPYVQLVE